MLLSLIAEVARQDGSAGPVVRCDEGYTLLRDWLCDALTPVSQRDARRLALAERVRDDLEKDGKLPKDELEAEKRIDIELHKRIRASGKSNLSRAVSELVAAGLMRRHYQGYRVDHQNRGAQRHAVYQLTGLSRALLVHKQTLSHAATQTAPRQGELHF